MDRQEILSTFKEIALRIQNNRDSIIALLSRIELFKTAVAEVDKTIVYLNSFDEELSEIKNRIPYGTVSIILPFNNPLYSLVLYGFGPALVGNKVNVKPSRHTIAPLLEIIKFFNDLLAKINISIIEIDGKEYVKTIAKEKHEVVIFTGSYQNSQNFLSEIDQSTKFVYCGAGVCSMIVDDGTDLDKASSSLLLSRFYNSGQDCLSNEIVYIKSNLYEEFIRLLLPKVKKLKVGKNSNPDSDVGELISERSALFIKERIEQSDFEVILEGKVDHSTVYPYILCLDALPANGYEEWFGPVICLYKYNDINEVIFNINNSEHCLGVSYFGKDIDYIREKLPNIPHLIHEENLINYECGVNHYPFGGRKHSGFIKENGTITDGPILFSKVTSIDYRGGKNMLNMKLFINGEFVDAVKKQTIETVNPATGEVIATLQQATQEDVDLAVKAAREAFPAWAAMEKYNRQAILNKIADLIDEHTEELARLDMIDAGKPFGDCMYDMPACSGFFRFYASAIDFVKVPIYPVQQGYMSYTKREPYGVVGAIVPWNYPLYNACLKVAPIIAMGNTCVLKPAEETSLSVLRLAELANEAGLPKGVLNILTGLGEITGEAISNHKGIDMVSFTGSTDVGRAIMRGSANSNLKTMSLELGGKSPFIIFEDANLENAVNALVLTIFYNQGQTCTAGSRLLVQKSVKAKVEKMLLEKVKKLVVGKPDDENTILGAVVNETQYKRVLNYIELGKKEATLLYGGEKITVKGAENGFYIMPTIFTNVKNNSRIAQEEIFGPVLSIIEFEGEEEAYKIANDVMYGLACMIWSENGSRVLRAIDNMHVGIVWCNCTSMENNSAPVGGFKQSGFGRECGMEACEYYTRAKTVWINYSGNQGGLV